MYQVIIPAIELYYVTVLKVLQYYNTHSVAAMDGTVGDCRRFEDNTTIRWPAHHVRPD